MRYLILVILISFIIAQDMQVKYVVAYTVDIDWGGEIETVSEITAAPGYGKFHGQLNHHLNDINMSNTKDAKIRNLLK